MLILLSCAKTMSFASKLKTPVQTLPRFFSEASGIALQMSQYSVDELAALLHLNRSLALENYQRYQEFHADTVAQLPALLAYTGIVFKRLKVKDFTEADFQYAQEHLRLTSFCYGLLRPLDLIRPYRLEGDVKLPELDGQTLFVYWRDRLTDMFISDIKSCGGILCYLASEEMKGLFNWSRVEREVQVVTPEFRILKNGKPTTIVIYAKMARGEMSRFILKNRITDIEALKSFVWEGFEWNESLSDDKHLFFVNGLAT